mgnify:CR=1 FL=1
MIVDGDYDDCDGDDDGDTVVSFFQKFTKTHSVVNTIYISERRSVETIHSRFKH